MFNRIHIVTSQPEAAIAFENAFGSQGKFNLTQRALKHPGSRLLGISNVKRMLWLPVAGKTQMKQGFVNRSQQLLNESSSP